jgi:hypothetical protein
MRVGAKSWSGSISLGESIVTEARPAQRSGLPSAERWTIIFVSVRTSSQTEGGLPASLAGIFRKVSIGKPPSSSGSAGRSGDMLTVRIRFPAGRSTVYMNCSRYPMLEPAESKPRSANFFGQPQISRPAAIGASAST